ncbi:hypothetical protein LCGC14_1401820 [marine sediment metagenome]|uniref:DUF559 domain-containing protein n=1 Tax=marine sediment metagenome TaxID=412755 RepID=A0A0F9MYG5_9ZZZZ
MSQFFILPFSFDFYLKKYKIIIEVQGDYWHANPERYKRDDIIPYPNGIKKKASDVWAQDEKKRKAVLNRDYKLVCIWERELKSIDDEQLQHLLSDKIKKTLCA